MRVLVLYHDYSGRLRRTFQDHLYSFERYSPAGVKVSYCNLLCGLPRPLLWARFDAYLLHYSLLSRRQEAEQWKHFRRLLRSLRGPGTWLAIPQDENQNSLQLRKMFTELGVETVFTCARDVDIERLYPQPRPQMVKVLTGYVDEASLPYIETLRSRARRTIDIGYRARDLPFWLGHHGREKARLAELFSGPFEDLKVDVSTSPEDVFLGDDWLRFLLSCRTAVGSLGGASLHDPDGSVRRRVESYVAKHPRAGFPKVAAHCFPGQDDSLGLFALSPRHFECAMTRTCQILVEGDYQGVLLPGVHYIELKKDFSNLDEVLEQVRDHEHCRRLAERCFQDLVASGRYSYRGFVEQVLGCVRPLSKAAPRQRLLDGLVAAWLRLQRRLGPWHRRLYGQFVKHFL